MKQPFSQKDLDDIFRTDPANPDVLTSRESSTLEFKESFRFEALLKAMKTIAGFANNEDGYLLFGVKDSPHIAQGLNEKSLQRLATFDPVKLTESLNNHFAPEIKFQIEKHEFHGKTFCLLYVWQSTVKPVMCIKTEVANLREAAIYYRYRGQSRESTYAELRAIIDSEIEKINARWMKTVKAIGDTGIAETVLLDLKSGKMTGPNATLFIDENLLDEISFVQEGSFVETGGNPALVVKGLVQTVVGAHKVVVEKNRTKAINEDELIQSFILQKEIDNPEEYIKQICYTYSANAPVYYYMNYGGFDVDKTLELLEAVNRNANVKSNLINRISTDSVKYRTATYATKEYRDSLLVGVLERPTDTSELRHCMYAILSMKKAEIQTQKEAVLNVLLWTYTDYFNDPDYKQVKSEIRNAICWVDEALYKDFIEGNE